MVLDVGSFKELCGQLFVEFVAVKLLRRLTSEDLEPYLHQIS
jgi:hypothetical protein